MILLYQLKIQLFLNDDLLTHEADSQSRPVVITIFTRGVRASFPTFQNLAEQNKFQSENSDLY